MNASTGRDRWRPALWLRSLAQTKKARWPWTRSARAAAAVAVPLAVAAVVGAPVVGLWVSMGALLTSAGERDVSYAQRFRQIAVSAPVGALGYLLGYASDAPPWAIVLLMTVVAFGCGIVSGYSGALSVGAMQLLLVASLALGISSITHYWQPPLLSLCGSAFAALLLGIEAALDRRRPQRSALVDGLESLAVLARARSEGQHDPAVARSRAIADIDRFRRLAIDGRARTEGPTLDYDKAALIARSADQVFARLISHDVSPGLCARAASLLTAMAGDVRGRRRPAPFEGDPTGLGRTLALRRAIAARLPRRHPGHVGVPWSIAPPGPQLVGSAARLALCMGLAYAVIYATSMTRGYWIALTVALVMKPDLGSVFARGVQRSVGTVAGAAIGAGAVLLPAGGPWEVVIIAVLAFLLPAAMGRSYLWQAVVLTPLVILLIRTISDHETALSLGGYRILMTVIGSAIVVVAGYLVWPSARHCRVAGPFATALGQLADYAGAIDAGSGPEIETRLRAQCYRSLSDVRVSVQRTLAEPPPAGREAWAWVPVVSSAERVWDRITDVSASHDGPITTEPDVRVLRGLADLVAGRDPSGARPTGGRGAIPVLDETAADPLVVDLADEIDHLFSQVRVGETTS